MKHIKGLSLGLCAMGACLHCIASTWTDENGYVWRYKETGDLFGVELYGDLSRDESALPRSVKGVVTVPSAIPALTGTIDEFQTTDLPVVEISQDAFYGCKYLTDIEVHPDNLYFASIDGVLYDYDITTLIRCKGRQAS